MARAAPLLRPLLPEGEAGFRRRCLRTFEPPNASRLCAVGRAGWHEVTGWWENVLAHVRAGERPMRTSASERDQRSETKPGLASIGFMRLSHFLLPNTDLRPITGS
jgi:hypothetical protein